MVFEIDLLDIIWFAFKIGLNYDLDDLESERDKNCSIGF